MLRPKEAADAELELTLMLYPLGIVFRVSSRKDPGT
jgi:hypothetical protein